jgi:hypothetical protein
MNAIDPRFIKFNKPLPLFITKLFIKAIIIDSLCILTSIVEIYFPSSLAPLPPERKYELLCDPPFPR